MKTKLLLLFVPVLFFMQGFRKPQKGPTYVAIIFQFRDSITCTDTLTISYQSVPKSGLNDSLRKYLGSGSSVKHVMIGQPTLILDSIDFKLFPEMRILTLAGDPDHIHDRKYDFMDAPKLEVIRAYQMYGYHESDPVSISDSAPIRFKQYILKYRPDVKVEDLRDGEFLLSE